MSDLAFLIVACGCGREPANVECSFVHAPSSRGKLHTTREMLCLLLTYQQIIPEFIDFIFPFGKQSKAQDFHYSAFRQRTRLLKSRQGLSLRKLGWSGSDFQICFNLKSVEHSDSQPDRPWSIRHCAVAHTFDVETGRASWIMIKGNKLMQKRMIAATSRCGSAELRDFRTINRSFAACLVVLQMLCDWMIEDWCWYINFLDDRYQDISRRTIVNEINLPSLRPMKDVGNIRKPQRVQTARSERSIFSKFSRKRAETAETFSSIGEKGEETIANTFTHRDTGLSQPLPPGVNYEGEELPEKDAVQYDDYGQQEFSFRDLQDLQFIDTKAGEAALVIEHVSNIFQQILQYYQTLFRLEEFPQEISTKCREEMIHFEMHVKGTVMELQLQTSRIETLQKSVSNCKTFVSQ